MPQVAARSSLRFRLPALLVAGLSCVATGYAVQLAIYTSGGQYADEQLMRRSDSSTWDAVAAFVLDSDTIPVVSAIVLVAVAARVVWARSVLGVVRAVLIVAGSSATAAFLKGALPRPDLLGTGMQNSFPSGTVAWVAALAAAATVTAAARVRPVLAVLGALCTSAVIGAVVTRQWHRPSDVIGALLIVATYTALAVAVTRKAPEAANTPVPHGIPTGVR